MRTVGAYTRLLASTWLALVVHSLPASAQGALGASGFSPVRTTHSVAPFEHVDPFSGNLLLTFTDLELPGNAGMHLRVQRVYNSKIHLDYHDTENHFKQRTWVGLGWSLHFGRVLHAESSTVEGMVIEMSDGSGHALMNAMAGDPDNAFGTGVTSELWRYDPASYTLRLTNGLRYIFGHVGIGGGPDGHVRYVTEINDQYGNKFLFDYFTGSGGSHPGPTDGIRRLRQLEGGTTKRTITFTVTPLTYGYALATMQYEGRTWTYSHAEPSSAPTQLWLNATSGPVAGTTWTYTYRVGSPGPELVKVVGPFGGELRYAYGDKHSHIYSLANSVRTRVVTERETGLTPTTTVGTWQFQYGTGPYENTSIVIGPTRRETFTYIGVGLNTGGGIAEFAPWITGALKRHAIESPTQTVLQETVNTWAWSAQISLDNVEPPTWDDQDPLPYGVWGAADVRRALLAQQTLTRGPQTWQTQLTYDCVGTATCERPSRYNDFFRPKGTASSHLGPTTRTRTTAQTFWYGTSATPYIRDRVASTTTTVGSESIASSTVYQNATGFPVQQTVRGITTTFTRTTRGNVATVTDAANKTTTFGYSHGVVSSVDTPDAGATVGVDITRTVNADGTIATERVGPVSGGLTTAFTYDALMRLTVVTPPGGTATTVTTYATPSQVEPYHQTWRGSTYQLTYLDGFGRAVRSQDANGVKTRVAFDAVGRLTRQYLPYTSGTGTRYVEHAYDALDRPTTVTTVEGTTTLATTTYTYNGSETWITDPEGRTTVYDYFSYSGPGGGHLEKVRDAASQETTYTYDVAGALRTTAGAVSGPRTWTYNAKGQLTSEVHPESGTTTYAWHPVNDTLTSVTTPNSETLTFSYDNAHRLVGRDAPGTAYDLSVTYDALGRVSQRTFGGVTTATQYDSAGRPSQRSDTLDGTTFTSTYAYDTLDRLVTLTYPSWHAATYAYAPAGRLTAVTWMGVPLATFAYHAETGHLTSYATGPVMHAITYDARDRVDLLSATSAAAPGALSLNYDYDRASLVTGIADTRPGHSQTFGYDALGRLTAAAGAYGTIGWSYDAAGNRTTETRSHPGGTATYSYTAGRLTGISGAATASFTYGTDGRTTAQTSNGVTTTFDYTATSLPTKVTTPSASALSVYDADEWRIARHVTVGGATSKHYSLRGPDAATLSEYRTACAGCALAWTADHIYGGGRLLATFAAPPSDPLVEFVGATSANTETWASPSFLVKVVTPDGLPTVAPITVPYATVDAGGGTATAGVDYTPATGVRAIPAGTASGATVAFGFGVLDDAMDEPNETILVRLGSPTNARLGGLATLTYTIFDDDPPPTLSVASITVNESAGQAVVTASLSAVSGHTVTATASTTPGTAVATHDFTPVVTPLTFLPGTTSQTVVVPLTNDGYAEPTETFTVALSALVHATVGTGSATVEVIDDDGPRVEIDPTYPGDYFALAHTTSGDQTYLQIFNPHAVAITARVTYVRYTGAGVEREFTVGPHQRIGLHVNADPFVTANVQTAAVVQSLDVARPLVAELSNYWGGNWEGGEAVEGVTPAPMWLFAEGATGLSVNFQEYFTIFNPTNEPLNVGMNFYDASGSLVLFKHVFVPTGPGLWHVQINPELPWSEHSTQVYAHNLAGQPRTIVVERLMRWNAAEGHRSTGTAASHPGWEFAEGGSGYFSTFVAVWNPHSTATPVVLYYRHENGTIYPQSVSIPALGRVVVAPPAGMPAGGFGVQVLTQSTNWIVAERMIYGGPNWELGHASPGARTHVGTGTTLRFAEGTAAGFFETYFLLTNLAGTPATVTLTYRTAAGAVIGSDALVIPAYGRGTVWANGTAGPQDFTTEVTSTQEILAERAMYWPTGSSSLLAGEASGLTSPGVEADEPPVAARSVGPAPYTLTEGVPGPVIVGGAEAREVVVGKRAPTSRSAAEGGTTQSSSSGPPWYGSHLTVGRRP